MSEKSKETNEIKKNNEENGDPFWSRILILTIIIVWIALVGGNWVGHYLVTSGILAKKSTVDGGEFRSMPAQKPKTWKMPVKTSTPQEPGEKTDQEKGEVSPTPGVGASPSPAESPSQEAKPSPAASSPSPKTEPKPSPKPEVKPSPKPEPKPSPKPEVKPSPKPAPKPSPKVEAKSSPVDEKSKFSVQLGNFEKQESADDLIKKLKEKGYAPSISKVGSRFKVTVGSYNQREKAGKTSEDLKKDGFDSFVVSE